MKNHPLLKGWFTKLKIYGSIYSLVTSDSVI